MTLRYHKICLNRKKDKELLKWLEEDRDPGENSTHAMKKKLYRLYLEDIERREKDEQAAM